MSDPLPLEALTGRLLAAAARAGADQADAVALSASAVSVEVRRGGLEHAERADGVEIGLRVLIGGRQASVSASDHSDRTIGEMAARAVAMAREAPVDDTLGLAEPGQLARDTDNSRLELLDDAPAPSPAELRQEALQAQKQMRVSFRGQSWVIDAAHPTLLFGRETGNDIVVSDPRVSRQHARIELRNGMFYLADSSTNGTYLLEEGSPERCVKRDELALAEKGHIGCGFSVADNMSDAVAFALD